MYDAPASEETSLHCKKPSFQASLAGARSQERRESFSASLPLLQNVCIDVQKIARIPYQIWQMLGRTILSVAAHLKAVRNSGMLESVPMRRYLSSGCGSVEARWRRESSVAIDFHTCAYARKKRCAGVNPSISLFALYCRVFMNALNAMVVPPRSAIASPCTCFPMMWLPGTGSYDEY